MCKEYNPTYPYRVDLRLKEDMYKELKKLAEKDERTMAYIVRKMIEKSLKDKDINDANRNCRC